MVFIYGLIDPFTFKVRYIGKTKTLKGRLSSQCNDKSNTHRSNWIQSLIKQGKKPIQVVLQELDDNEDWRPSEIKWIAIARKYGWKLVNSTDGGDGVTNISGEGKERMLAACTGRKHTPETIAKLQIRSQNQIISEPHKDKVSEKMKGREILWADKLQIANRKFTDEDLKNIIDELNSGTKGIHLAKKYNVHRTTISKIKSGTYLTFKQKTVNYKKPRRYDRNKPKDEL